MNTSNIEKFLQDFRRISTMDAAPLELPFLRIRTAANGLYEATYSGVPSTLAGKLAAQKNALEGNIAALATEYGLVARPHLEMVPKSFTEENTSGVLSIEGVEFNNQMYAELSDDEIELYFRERQHLPVREMPEFYSGQPVLGFNHKAGSAIAHIAVNTNLMKGHFWYHGHKRLNTFEVSSEGGRFYLNERMTSPTGKLGDGALTHFLEMLQ